MMSQPTRSSVRTYSRTTRPVLAEPMEGRQMFAAAPPSHGWGPPHGGRFEAMRAEYSVMMTAVAVARIAAIESAAAQSGEITLASQQAAAPDAAPASAPAARGVNRPVPVVATNNKAEAVAVRHADDVDAAVQMTAVPADAAATDTDAPAGRTFGPFNVTTTMAATPVAVPTLTWTPATESTVLRPDVTPTVAGRTAAAAAKAEEITPADPVVADAAAVQQAALGLPTESIAGRPMWQRISAAVAGATLVAVNYVVRRRRRQLAIGAMR